MFVVGWVFAAIIIGAIGSTRKMGFFVSFLASLILSPLVALILLAFDKKKDDPTAEAAISTEIEKLFELKKTGALTEDEFEKKKKKLLRD